MAAIGCGPAKIASGGITMAVVTHEMSFAREVADRIVMMDGGRVIEIASADAFFAAPQQHRTQAFLGKFRQI